VINMVFDNTYIIAEVGINHNGDYDLAVKSVEEAAKTGVDAVKFQSFRTEDFIFDKKLKFTYQSQGVTKTESMWDLFKRTEMGDDWIPKLKTICDRHGLDLLSTPTNQAGIDQLVEAGVKMLKNGSDYLSHISVLELMGKTGLPVVMSTGMAEAIEIREAIEAVRRGGSSEVILLHCTSVYPTKPSDTNLRRMIALQGEFGVRVGFSDHTVGSQAAVQAVTLGACILEKHFTLDHDLPGPDHWFSLDPGEMKTYVKHIRDAEQNLGSAEIRPALSEKDACRENKLSIRVRHDMAAGQEISAEDLTVARPADGLPPKEFNNLIGKTLTKNIGKGSAVTFDHVQSEKAMQNQR